MKSGTAGAQINPSPFGLKHFGRRNMRKTALLAAALIGLVYGVSATANPLLCSSEDYAGSLTVGDVTFSKSENVDQVADDCYGEISGNDNAGNIWPTGVWTLLAKSDDGPYSNTVEGVEFTLSDVPSGSPTISSGDWTLSWSEVSSPGFDLTMDLVAVTKAADDFGSYLFESLMFTADPLSGTGTWEVTYTVPGPSGNIPDLSHLSLYYSNVSSTPPNGNGAPPANGIPEPATLGLLGLGLLGLVAATRRRNHG